MSAPTEWRNPRTLDIDTLGALDIVRLINDADHRVPRAVQAVLPKIAAAVEVAVRAVRSGGRVHYVGAGASGRIGAVDAAELVPTYGVDVFVAHLAGGPAAMLGALEGVEDDAAAGAAAITGVGPDDIVIGIAASGQTPYVAGALRAARAAGAPTVLVSANLDAALAGLADIHIGVDTGPEVITGSTRMKAASAQKLVLNAFSTAVMVRLGCTYSNLMVELAPLNTKLRARQVLLLQQATRRDAATCADALSQARGEVKVALVSLLTEVPVAHAARALERADGSVRRALAE
jgi:N-acetylmuramic acid 6-phosphate etherase